MAGQSPARSKDPHLTRRGLPAHPGTLLLGVVAIVFTAYVLGYLPQFDTIFRELLKSCQDEGFAIVAPILLGLVSLFALVLLLLTLRSIGHLFRSFDKLTRFSGRKAVSLQSFTKSAEMQGIHVRVAQETYRALAPHYPTRMCIQLQDHLWHQLHLSEENIMFIRSNILNRCDRREVLFFSVGGLDTVLDLMRHVESAPPQHVRNTDGPAGEGGGVEFGRREGDRLPVEMLERRAQPADGGLHGAPMPGRRRGDYDGPRRRSSDLPKTPPLGLQVPLATNLPEDRLPEPKPSFFYPRGRSTDFVPRRRSDLFAKEPATKPDD
jgi:hypothetical protein